MTTGKKKKRKISRGGTSAKLYFDNNTQEAIKAYQLLGTAESDVEEKNRLYVEKIYPAFEKLAENLIFVYKLITAQDDYEILKNDCVNFLYEAIHKWNPEKGTKAFSYFNVVAKNWLLMHLRKNKKNAQRYVSLDNSTEMNSGDKSTLANYHVIPGPDEIMISRIEKEETIQRLKKVKQKTRGEKELACINSVIVLFENIDQIEFLNKRAVFVYIREISGLNPKQLSVAMSSIRRTYKAIKKEES